MAIPLTLRDVHEIARSERVTAHPSSLSPASLDFPLRRVVPPILTTDPLMSGLEDILPELGLDVVELVAISVLLLNMSALCSRKHRSFIERDKISFEHLTDHLSDDQFKGNFRLSREGFRLLLKLLRPWISKFAEEDKEKEVQQHLSGNYIQAEIRVAVFLRMMAGGSAHDISLAYRIGESSVYQVFQKLLEVVCERLPFESFPDSSDERGFRRMAAEFSESRPHSNPLRGCVAALDGIQIQIEKPPKWYNPLHYFCRKGFFSVPVQAIVDSSYRFIASSTMCVGSTHDSVAFELSNIADYLRSGKLPKGFWIAGDEAYRCSEHVCTPFPRTFASKYQDSYNFSSPHTEYTWSRHLECSSSGGAFYGVH